ncbi:hypothetical protein [Streptomyces rishiriensis]|uniref:hypothetical protein n=1 Tax=Streptomyces rishiriensis TaxID=68264 RepID=UPI001FE3F0FB|nr:hypothetical protein [Streptomyces rishiriensis]
MRHIGFAEHMAGRLDRARAHFEEEEATELAEATDSHGVLRWVTEARKEIGLP